MVKNYPKNGFFQVLVRALDVSAKVAVFFYLIPVNFVAFILVFDVILNKTGIVNLLFIPFWLGIFLLHAIYSQRYDSFNWDDIWNNKSNTRIFYSFFII